MKKIFLFLIAASAVLTSCGSDDGGGAKRPSMVTIQGGTESYAFSMTYDKGRVATMTSNAGGAHTFAFSYNEKGKVSTVSVTGSLTSTMTFTYDGSGKLSTFTRSGQDPWVATWTDANTVTIDGTTIKLDNNGDIVFYDTATITYDTGKGAFASVKGVDALSMMLIENYSLYYASKKPLKTVSATGQSIVFNNALSEGYLSTANFTIGTDTYITNVLY